MRILGSSAAALCAALAVAAPASAQEPSAADIAKARTAFREGVARAAAGDCVGALAKYKEVAQVKMTPQVAFNTAECEAKLGKLVSALGNYRVAAAQAADDKKAAAVLKEAPNRVDDLEARVPRLTITRTKSAEMATIELDGSDVGSTICKATPVDPGTHTVVARVGNKEYLHETVTLAEKEKKTFEVNVTLPTAHVEAPPTDQPPPDQKPQEPQGKSKVPGIALTAAGGVVTVIGLAMLGPRQSAISKLSTDCHDGHCPMNDSSTADQGKLFTGLTEVMVPVGVIGLAVGIALIVKAGPSSGDKDKAAPADDKGSGDDKKDKDAWWRSVHVVAAAPGASIGGVSLAGSF